MTAPCNFFAQKIFFGAKWHAGRRHLAHWPRCIMLGFGNLPNSPIFAPLFAP